MNITLLLEMGSSALPDRPAVTDVSASLSYSELHQRALSAGAQFVDLHATAVIYLGTSHVAHPTALFGAAYAGVPYIPLNYRLGAEQLGSLIGAHPGAVVIHQGEPPELGAGQSAIERDAFMIGLGQARADADGSREDLLRPTGPDGICVLLYTSGTTAAPKAAVLRHRHVLAYMFSTIEFGSAGEEEAALVAVPPYHVAGLANLLSNLYAGRRLVFLPAFTAAGWLDRVQRERITQAMVVPTMLAAVEEHLGDGAVADVPSLRTLSYGGAKMPLSVLERALTMFPKVGFVHAYGLTETSSTIALLAPDDHRVSSESDDPAVRARLSSVGRLVPGVELEIRDENGSVLEAGSVGELYLRGPQIAGEYLGATGLDDAGWFPTRDFGWVDDEGYVFVQGRMDDTIIRGGENIAPAEIEDVLVNHPSIIDAAVVGLPDDRWGQRVVAAVVVAEGASIESDEVREWCRQRLRTSKTPEAITVWESLPRTDTGKLLRRRIIEQLDGRLVI